MLQYLNKIYQFDKLHLILKSNSLTHTTTLKDMEKRYQGRWNTRINIVSTVGDFREIFKICLIGNRYAKLYRKKGEDEQKINNNYSHFII